MAEIQAELDAPERNQQALEAEIGDALFAMVNLARHCNVDADAALRRASQKFATRFTAVESLAKAQKGAIDAHTLDELELLWQQVKRTETLL